MGILDHAAMLPPRALKGSAIGLSASPSEDLGRLGLMPEHFELALRELARIVLVSGGTLVYGGNLDRDSLTWVLIHELRRYADEALGSGFRSVLHWYEHRRRSLAVLDDAEQQMGVLGELVCLARDEPVALADRRAGRADDAEAPQTDEQALARSLTTMRRWLTAHTHGRMVIGGKRAGYKGELPGLLQEALMSLEAGHPLYLAGGFGGITLDIAGAVDPAARALLPRRDDDTPLDAPTLQGLAAVRAHVGDAPWSRLNNGLSDDENRRLAATHRPAEIAALVSLGLGRVLRNGAAGTPR